MGKLNRRPRKGMANAKRLSARTMALLRFGCKCAACSSSRDLTVHHLNGTRYKVTKGGKKHPICDTQTGLVALCRACHDLWHQVDESGRGVTFEDWLGKHIPDQESPPQEPPQ